MASGRLVLKGENPMSVYAKNTNVPVEQTQMEIQNLLKKYGAVQFGMDWERNAILFKIKNRSVCITVPLPKKEDFRLTPTHIKRNYSQLENAYQQAVRQRWRALLLIIKAKMEAIATGITSLEKEFLADILLPNKQSLGEYLIPQLTQVDLFPQLPRNAPGPKKIEGES